MTSPLALVAVIVAGATGPASVDGVRASADRSPVAPAADEPASRSPGAFSPGALSPRASSSSSSLPAALPPLDASLLAAASAPLEVFAGARLRLVRDDGGAGVGRADVAGAGWTGRVGVTGPVGAATATVVVGDGAWALLAPSSPSASWPSQPGPALVDRPPVPALVQAVLAVPLEIAGLAATVSLGRQTPVVADGRWWGAEPFDARGRTADGVVVDLDLAPLDHALVLAAGALWTDLSSGPSTPPAAFITLARRAADVDDRVAADVYALAWPSASGDARAIAGSRATFRTGPLDLRLGVDALGAPGSGAPLVAWHGEAAATTTLPWAAPTPRPFIDVGVEATEGQVRWAAPAPSAHATLGALDLVNVDGTRQVRGAGGFVDDDGFVARLGWRYVARAGARPLRRLDGGALGVDAFAEVDVDVVVPIDDRAALELVWAGAPLPGGFAQRFLATLRFELGAPRGLPPWTSTLR